MSTAALVKPSGLTRWAALGGVAYVVLFILGVIVSDSGAARLRRSAGGGDQVSGAIAATATRLALGWGLIVLGVFFFLWFLGALREFLRRVDADGLLTTLAMVGGSVYAALTLTGAGLQAGILTMSDDTYRDQVYPGADPRGPGRGLRHPHQSEARARLR